MNILITGGAGFIGSHLCEHLNTSGAKVTVIDNLSSGSINNLSTIIDKITFFERSVEDFDFNNLPDLDAVVHLAAQVSVPLSIKNFYESSKTNLLSSIKIIDFCSKRKIPLVYASSSAVYGGLPYGDDECAKTDLLSPYAADKFCLEIYSKIAFQVSSISSIGLRFFNVYGPRQDPSNLYSGVISIFSKKSLLNEDITINGGSQTRDFVYVKNVVDVIIKSINVAKDNKICDQVNVLTGRSISIDALADQIILATNSSCGKNYVDHLAGDPSESNGSGAKILKVLNMDTTKFIGLKEGLNSTIEHMRSESSNL